MDITPGPCGLCASNRHVTTNCSFFHDAKKAVKDATAKRIADQDKVKADKLAATAALGDGKG